MIGKTLAHYEITDLLGKGGMGAVYRARDTSLGRDVALKVLPQEFARDAERLARFQREARTLAALSHPNIAPLFGYEEADGERFLVMELIEGEDLSQRLARGQLTIDESLEIAVQIADGLDAAHEKNIVHRDLKPANVKLTPDGQVKLLDFGLARANLQSGADDSGSVENSPTITAAFTQAQTILGTAAYMSPEQARGRPVDKRADIWAFGVILFEMLSGARLFEGETVSDTLAGILKSPPEWSLLPPETPPRVRELLDRCLAKRRRDRLRDIGDARYELAAALSPETSPVPGVSEGAAAASATISRRTLAIVTATMLLFGGAVGAGLWATLGPKSAASDAVTSLSLTLPRGRIGQTEAAISPDGSVVAYAARQENASNPEEGTWRLFLRRIDEYAARFVEKSYGASHWSFSPDGRWCAFVGAESPTSSSRQLYRIRIDDRSPPVALGDWDSNRWGSLIWPTDDNIIVTTSIPPQQIIRIAADGSGVRDSVQIAKLDDDWLAPIAMLPNRVHALCISVSFDVGYEWNTSLLDLQTGAVQPLLDDAGIARWSPTGHLLFTRHDNLLAVPFDLENLEVTGGPVAVLQDLRVNTVFAGAPFSLSSTGTLLYAQGGIMGANRRLAILDREGSVEDWAPERRSYWFGPLESPNGDWVAVVGLGETGLNEIWVSRNDQRDHRVLVAEPGLDCQNLVFSPVDDRVVYDCADNAGGGGLYVKPVDGSGAATLLRRRKEDEQIVTLAFWPDGTRVLCGLATAEGMDLFEHPIDAPTTADDAPAPLVSGVVGWRASGVSPDGRWISYLSEVSGRRELYIRRYLGDGKVGGEIPVTSGGARITWWSPDVEDDGTLRLYYVNQDQEYVAVDVQPGSRPRFSRRALTTLSPILRDAQDVRPLRDGRWLVILKGEEEVPLREYRVVTNWTQHLERVLAAVSD